MIFSRKKPSQKAVTSETAVIPSHVAIIMDGNGRWAKKRHLPRLAGHRAGTENIRRIIELFVDYKIGYLTLYVFSTENWKRPSAEVKGLMRILDHMIVKEVKKLHENGVKIVHLGKSDGIPKALYSKIEKAAKLTKNNTKMILNIAFNYGGRTEIIDAVRRIVSDGVAVVNIDEELLNNYMYTAGMPDPDLIIRTGGEMRISNFLVWQSVYSEYYATPALWPDFGKEEVDKALRAYSKRKRRFGGLDKSK
ncbi:isoprenyl transferase [Chloroflexota bacterium]